jgi:hypothetical protein
VQIAGAGVYGSCKLLLLLVREELKLSRAFYRNLFDFNGILTSEA